MTRNAPIYINIRYDYGNEHNAFVVNSLQNNIWQREEGPPGFPFDSGYFTTVKIVPSSEASAYKIYANGKHIYDFQYRSPDKVKSVYVNTQDVSKPINF